MGTTPAVQRFAFAFQRRYQPALALIGVSPVTSGVTITADRVVARFGLWVCRSSLDNIVDACLTGPYHPLKAIGVRLSATDGGLTFGSTAAGGVCLLFAEPVPGFDPAGLLRHRGLTVTVADREGFAAAVRGAAGIGGASGPLDDR